MTSTYMTNEKGIVGKICSKCKLWYPLTEYNKDDYQKDGLRCCCRNCSNNSYNNYYIKNKEKVLKKKYDYNKTLRGRYLLYKREAIKRSYEFLLDYDEFCGLVSQPCYYCGNIDLPYNGIDRFDNSKGYILDNCVPCCTMCNLMKRHHPVDTFIKQCRLIIEKNKC